MDSINNIISDRNKFAEKKVRKPKKAAPKKIPIIFDERILIPCPLPSTPNNPCEGYVYFISCASPAERKPVKIGQTKDLNSRISTLQTGSPYKLSFYKVLRCVDYKDVEVDLHFEFADKKILNEWFDITEKDIDNVLDSLCLAQFTHPVP